VLARLSSNLLLCCAMMAKIKGCFRQLNGPNLEVYLYSHFVQSPDMVTVADTTLMINVMMNNSRARSTSYCCNSWSYLNSSLIVVANFTDG
jgi:hypothetical protein